MLNELLLVGYYPAVVWLAYLLAGMAMGRVDLRRKGVDVRLLASGSLLAVAAPAVSRVLLARADAAAALASTYPDPSVGSDPAALHTALTHGLHGTTPTGSWWWLATVAPHSGSPLDLAQTIGSAMAVLGLCLLVTRFQPRVWAAAFGAGAVTLSLYTLHVVLMGRGWWPDLETPDHYDDQVLIVLGIGAVLALVPLRGPLEAAVSMMSRTVAAALTEPARGPSPAAYGPPGR